MTEVRVLPQHLRYEVSPVPCFEPKCYAPAETPCIGERRAPGHRQRHLNKIHPSRAALAAMEPEAQAAEIGRRTALVLKKVSKDPQKLSKRARRYLAER